MRSIKPGRGPSWAGVIGGVIVAVFGCFWVAMALSMGAPSFFVAFGVVFVLCALGGASYNFYNATSRNRFSDWDITGPNEERDPLDATNTHPKHCPFCGGGVALQFEFCPQCGKQLPKR